LHSKTWAVVVMPRQRWSRILAELDLLDIQAWPAETCQEARKLLEKTPQVAVVISDLSLPDGNWCDVFKHLIDNDIHASMVVTARHADERLWSEVLWRGAYDLLVEPYTDLDVRRVVEGAIRATQGGAVTQAVAAGTAPALAIETAVAAS
jgi:FixJ family two-component response regulator